MLSTFFQICYLPFRKITLFQISILKPKTTKLVFVFYCCLWFFAIYFLLSKHFVISKKKKLKQHKSYLKMEWLSKNVELLGVPGEYWYCCIEVCCISVELANGGDINILRILLLSTAWIIRIYFENKIRICIVQINTHHWNMVLHHTRKTLQSPTCINCSPWMYPSTPAINCYNKLDALFATKVMKIKYENQNFL
jgi:hypothetical protein